MRILKLLNQSWFILILAFVLALLAGDMARYIKPLVMPVVIMVILLLQVIVLPFIIARVLMKAASFRRLLLFRGTLINWGMFLVTFTSVGLNSSTFFSHPDMVAGAVMVSVLSIFGTSIVIEWVLKMFNVGRETRVPVLLMSTIKNGGFAVVAAMALAGERASAAAAVFSGFTAIFLVYLSVRDKWKAF